MSEQRFVLAGVMGWPVAHTRSPVIHNHWIAKHGLKGAYVQLPVQPDRLEAAIRGLPALGFAGCNITVPHKVNAMQLMDELHPQARRIAAINTVVVQPDGRLLGVNNDGIGYIQSLRDANPGWRGDAGPALVLGAGGAARAIVVALLDEGVPELRITNRTLEKAQALKDAFGDRVTVVPWAERNQAMAGVSLLVNTTTQGMHGQPALDVQLDDLPASAMVSDAIYIPLETPLLAAARQRGHQTVNGLGMLLNQARPAFQAWFGVLPEITPELRAAVQATF
ncbi:shikimate dehydrogenase [Rhodoferax sp. TS-BS-61-7]|uniref:shikimate dehydrogenase n=1 Tax=Rhodoferax sp. TS-BS-61-7 TaxID=2094194 RepID=UPI000CF741BC|nr:shikimate dehydrogenase [Rhodoferax sp. TS-BS-61-7]PQA75719.1 shikimate dehydrogenase [Rhodoferax sp. TS-BS-61-7]